MANSSRLFGWKSVKADNQLARSWQPRDSSPHDVHLLSSANNNRNVSRNARIDVVAQRWESFFRPELSNHANEASDAPAIAYIRQLKAFVKQQHIPTTNDSSSGTSSASSSLGSKFTPASLLLINTLLRNLEEVLDMASNFRMDFIQQNGITMLCRALKKLQDEIATWENAEDPEDLDVLKSRMVDEFHCIMCIKFATRDLDGCNEVLSVSAENLAIVCQSLLSPCMQSRIAVMDFLANLIHANPKEALRPVLQQFTTLRLRYAQQDRFRFLVGTTQTGGKLNLLFKASLLSMTNEMLSACPSGNYQVYLQTELEEAGLNVNEVEKAANLLTSNRDSFEDAANVVRQVSIWRENYIMVDKPRKKFTAVAAQTSRSPISQASTLPTYEYGFDSAGPTPSDQSSHTAVVPSPPVPVLPRTSSLHTGEIKVVIKSISPPHGSPSPVSFSSAAEIHPPPLPPRPVPSAVFPERGSKLAESQMIQQRAPEEIVTMQHRKLLLKQHADDDTITTDVHTKFATGPRQMQSLNLNQRMAEKFSNEFHDWQRKRSGDSVDSGESSDSADSAGADYRAVYLVDGVTPAQRTLIDDVLLQFDRAYDVLDDADPIADE